MRLGILSDSHGRHEMVRRAVGLFDEHGVEHIVHCGDVGGMGVFDELVGRSCRFVWGNCDHPDAAIMRYLKTVGIPLPEAVPLRFELSGKRFAVYHGHEREARHMEALDDVDYVLHGHTHARRDERAGRVRIINPGALFRARPASVAILEVVDDRLEFFELSRS